MNLNNKVTVLVGGITLGILVMLVAISLYAFRSFSISTSTAHIRTAAEVVRVHLTESMIQGTIGQREQFLDRLMEVQGLAYARVVRGQKVDQQFGEGLARETSVDEIERAVLADGTARYELTDQNGTPMFRGTIPFVATTVGTPNCLSCHAVNEGEVLGAVTMQMSIADITHRAILTVIALVTVVALFAGFSVVLMRRTIQPIGLAAREVEEAVRRALHGEFKSKIDQKPDDEIGKIAEDTNRLLGYLDTGFERITRRVMQLTGYRPERDENQLEVTIEMVNSLADAATFRQAIQEDETREEIYLRFGRLLRERFGIATFSAYETSDQRTLVPVIVDGGAGAACRWCDSQILARADMCRAKRTGHVVDGLSQPGLCYAFDAESAEAGYRHYCVPIMQAGTVGSVIQVVAAAGDIARACQDTPFLNVYLREMAPVLEAKRLTESLRESSVRDAMTGLYNRRFLEEYVDTLMAASRRRKVSLGIMLLDLDYFKMVNDTYGHDAGDTVLRALAKVLRESVRASDLVIRFGGEEFLIVLNDTDAEGAMKVAEQVRESVQALKIQIAGGVLQKTISIGLAILPDDGDSFWQTVKFADVALYRAKENGRNQVMRFTEDMWDGEAGTY